MTQKHEKRDMWWAGNEKYMGNILGGPSRVLKNIIHYELRQASF